MAHCHVRGEHAAHLDVALRICGRLKGFTRRSKTDQYPIRRSAQLPKMSAERSSVSGEAPSVRVDGTLVVLASGKPASMAGASMIITLSVLPTFAVERILRTAEGFVAKVVDRIRGFDRFDQLQDGRPGRPLDMDTEVSTPLVCKMPSGSFDPPPLIAAWSTACARMSAKSDRTSASMSGEDCNSMLRENSAKAPTCLGVSCAFSNW